MDITVLSVLFLACCLIYGAVRVTSSLAAGEKAGVLRDYKYTPKVSVMLSCFNEGDAVYKTIESIFNSDYPKDLLEVVAFDDCSKDDSWEWMQRAAIDYPATRIFRNDKNSGKAPTLANASEHTTGNIIVCTDADTIFDVRAIRELTSCFGDPSIGACGGVIGIANANASLLAQMQTMLYAMSFWLAKPMENITKTVQCLGGPLVAFRRGLYLDIVPMVFTRNFLGEIIHNGEDRYITQQVLLRGWKTFVTHKAKCWVGTPVTWGNYFKQQLRWRRSAIGQWVGTFFSLHRYISRAGMVATMGSMFPMMGNYVWILYLIYLFEAGQFLHMLATLLLIKLFVMPFFGLGFNLLMGRKDLVQKLKNPILASLLIPFWWGLSFSVVTIWAACTLDDGGWVTRQNGANGNS